MNKYDLAILIPARNEQFLAKTVESVLSAIKGNTEIIVFLDGQWADPGIPAHDRVTIVYSPIAIGQRAATNQACRLTKAKYVMKLDAHCILDDGFDIKLLEHFEDDWTVIPVMYNLHAFDWVCAKCGSREYQGPSEKFKQCKCGGTREKEIIWKPRLNRKSTFYRFDKTLHFQYWGSFGERPEAQGDIVPTMSAQGSCFVLTRQKYWELDICDEKHGSWGQQGVEVAMKTWLSGGKLMVNKTTWYSHMFRTQGGDFGFPYPLSGSDVEKARKYSRFLWVEGNWKPAKHDLNWLLDKFYPVPDWHDNSKGTKGNEKVQKGIIFYTDNQLKLKYAHAVQKQLQKVNIPIISVSLKPMPHFGTNIHLPLERGMETYFTQIITALEKSTADIVYMCEHDVLYHPSHFDFIPPTKDKFYYNQNFWRVRPEVDNFAVHWDANQVSGLVCYRELLLSWYKDKWKSVQESGFDRSYEPGGRDKSVYGVYKSEYPNIDIRHSGNLTKSKWSPADFRDKSTCVNWQESTIEQIPEWNIASLLY
jgi:glycosyltransferase involved in cell wall biosynthesis